MRDPRLKLGVPGSVNTFRYWLVLWHDPFGGVLGLLLGEMIGDMDKTREFWLRLGVIVGALILMSSAMAAFFD